MIPRLALWWNRVIHALNIESEEVRSTRLWEGTGNNGTRRTFPSSAVVTYPRLEGAVTKASKQTLYEMQDRRCNACFQRKLSMAAESHNKIIQMHRYSHGPLI